MAQLLIIEDEKHIAEGLKFNLESEGHQVTWVVTAEEALPIFSEHDLILLDLMLPGMSGIELLKEIRCKDYLKPVLILSARTAEEDLIEGLSAGADDYLKKPFSLMELLLRIRRLLERVTWPKRPVFPSEAAARYELGDYWIDFETLEANTNQGKRSLTHYEGYLMKYLVENPLRVVSREELLREVWGYEKGTPETRTVDIFIARLRKLFEQNTKDPKRIQSVRGMGYRFCPPGNTDT